MGRTAPARRRRTRVIRVRRPPLLGYVEAVGQRPCGLVLGVGRRTGNAVVRNRAKRILRDVFRETGIRTPEGFLVTIVVEADLSRTPRRSLRMAAENLLKDLRHAWTARQPSHGAPAGRWWGPSAYTR